MDWFVHPHLSAFDAVLPCDCIPWSLLVTGLFDAASMYDFMTIRTPLYLPDYLIHLQYLKITEHKTTREVSGRSKPPSVSAAFSYASYPDRYQAIQWSCSDLHPQGFAVSPIPVCWRSAGLTRNVWTWRWNRLNRFMTENRPCRFCAIAVTLATRTCIRLRAWLVGGLSSAATKATVSRSLPLL